MSDEVEVRILAPERSPRSLAAALPDRDAPKQAQREPGAAGAVHQAAPLWLDRLAHSGGISRNVFWSEIPWRRRYIDTPTNHIAAMIGATNTLIIGAQPSLPPNPV